MLNINLYKEIEKLLQDINLTNDQKNYIYYYFKEFLGSLIFSNKDIIIDFRNPSTYYKIERKKGELRINSTFYTNDNFFSLQIVEPNNAISPTFSYKEVFNGVMREDLIWLENNFPKKIESRFYDAASWNYILSEIEKENNPISLKKLNRKPNNEVFDTFADLHSFKPIDLIIMAFKPEIVPDYAVYSSEENGLEEIIKGRYETRMESSNWFYNHLYYLYNNEHIKSLATSADYPRNRKF